MPDQPSVLLLMMMVMMMMMTMMMVRMMMMMVVMMIYTGRGAAEIPEPKFPLEMKGSKAQ